MSTIALTDARSMRSLAETERLALQSRLEDMFGVQDATFCSDGSPCFSRPVHSLWESRTAALSVHYQRVTVVDGTRAEETLLRTMDALYNRTATFEFDGSDYNARISSAIADVERPAGAGGGHPYSVTARVLVSYHVSLVRPSAGGFALSA